MCTVLLRFDPSAAWPLLLAAVRDEFMGREWDEPAAHWPDQPTVVGGRDRVAGGTWLAVDIPGVGERSRHRAAVAALLNGVVRPPTDDGAPRPTRGRLPLAALSAVNEPDGVAGPVPGIMSEAELARYDGFHLLRADTSSVQVWSWDGVELTEQHLTPGDHIIVNLGVDRDEDPLVPHFRPLLAATDSPKLDPDRASTEAWSGWVELLRGDDLDPADERGLIIAHEVAGTHYGSTSASLVGFSRDGVVRYDFTATPATPHWHPSI